MITAESNEPRHRKVAFLASDFFEIGLSFPHSLFVLALKREILIDFPGPLGDAVFCIRLLVRRRKRG